MADRSIFEKHTVNLGRPVGKIYSVYYQRQFFNTQIYTSHAVIQLNIQSLKTMLLFQSDSVIGNQKIILGK